jgi:hypothetical protein
MSTQLGAPVTVLRAHEELFAYWAGLRQRGALPRRSDLDPGRMKRLLPTVSLTQVIREPLDYRLRLAGTGLYAVYGGEITGWSPSAAPAPAITAWPGAAPHTRRCCGCACRSLTTATTST